VADFLSASWFERLNEALRSAGHAPTKTDIVIRIVFQLTNAPSGAPDALTFTINGREASVDPGDNLLADTLVTLAYGDARALFRGKLDSASALREGRVKVRGDINALVPLLSWMQDAHPFSQTDDGGDEDSDSEV
jgi:putative sterol carrier protein